MVAGGDAVPVRTRENPMTTLAEDLVLLLVDPGSGRIVVDATALDRGIAGALLLDLALRERMGADVDGRRVWLHVADPAPTGEPVLDAAMATLGVERLRAVRAVERLSRQAREPVLRRLQARGLVRRIHGRRLGLFPATRWEVLDFATHRVLRERVAVVLLHGGPPDVRLACLISLLYAVRAERRVVDAPSRLVSVRAAEIARGERIGSAVRNAVDGTRNVVVMAVFSAAVGTPRQRLSA